MHSLVSRARRPLELVLRLGGVGLLAWAWSLSVGAVAAPGEGSAGSADLRAQLERWSSVASPARVQVRFAQAPGAVDRDWLAALDATGTRVAWSADSLPPTAAAVNPLPDPAGGMELAVAAPAGAPVLLRDTLGSRDSVAATPLPIRFHIQRLEAGTEVVTGGARSRDEPRDSLTFRRLLLLGRAGWDARFVSSALSERGWTVDARFVVAPGSDVHQGVPGPKTATPPATVLADPGSAPGSMMSRMRLGVTPPATPVPVASPPPAVSPRLSIDTSRYSAVLVLDSTAGREAGAISRYLRDGGGIILWTEALNHPAFRAMAAGGSGTPVAPTEEAVTDSLPRITLGLVPITPLHPDAVVLESRGTVPAVAARRIGAGRVVQVGYQDLWRWPMAGDSLAPDQFRNWVAGLVVRVAVVGRTTQEARDADPAPRAMLVDRLGSPTPPVATIGESNAALPWWLLALVTGAFLVEWASRRIRGAR